ncbi:MAG: LacI family DNA-binding transcriptional regulator [Candidatus Puniceispirillaceae bacterium]
MKRRTTIIEVAQKAGVSKSTVSLVLQNSSLVKNETRDKVRAAMDALNYVYNRSAAHLGGSATGLIGLIINDLRNPFFTEFATSVQMALAERGYMVVLGNSNEEPALQRQLLSSMVEHGVSGLIVSPAYDDNAHSFDICHKASVPTLQVLRKLDSRTDLFPFSAPDYEAGGREATAHLLAQNIRHIAFVGGEEGRKITQERLSGYQAVLEENAITPQFFFGATSHQFGRETAHMLAKQHPEIEAVICFNDRVALGVLAGSRDMDRQVGHDLKIIGFDNIEECQHSQPPLSSVSCDIAEFGQEVAQRMADWLEAKQEPLRETRSSVRLIARGSSLTLS